MEGLKSHVKADPTAILVVVSERFHHLADKGEHPLRNCSLLHVAKCIRLFPSVSSLPLHAYVVTPSRTSILPVTAAEMRAVWYSLAAYQALSFVSFVSFVLFVVNVSWHQACVDSTLRQ